MACPPFGTSAIGRFYCILKIYVINFPIYPIYICHQILDKSKVQKQPPVEIFFKKVKFSLKIRNIHRKISVLESLFNKVTGLQACNFTQKRLQRNLFPVNIANFKNTYFEKHQRTAASDGSCIFHRKLHKIIE